MRKKKQIYRKLALLLSFALVVTTVSALNRNSAHAEADYGLHNPVVGTVKTHTWETVYFGNYWQNDTNGDGIANQKDEKEPVLWRVLSMDDEEVFLLADQNLDCQPYNEKDEGVTWETCTLRNWLNGEFYNNAFSKEEQNAIKTTNVVNEDNPDYGTEGGNNTKDKIYLLSISEVMNPSYGFAESVSEETEARRAKNTQYVKDSGAYTYWEGNGTWGLRSPGESSLYAAFVYVFGTVDRMGGNVYYDEDFDFGYKGAVRPALRIQRSTYDQCKKGETLTAHIKEPITTWDGVYFGNYWQNDTNGDGKADANDNKQPIKWRVLSVNGDDAFLLADQNLDYQPYNEEEKDVTWETCTLRSWLNGEFLNNAFSEEEQGAIRTTNVVNEDNPDYGTEGGNDTQDKVYLLSIGEAMNPSYGFKKDHYGTKTREAKHTEYVINKGADAYWSQGEWWLRSSGNSSNSAADVCSFGWGIQTDYSVSYTYAVRPVLRLDLSSSLWSPAGQVSSGEEDDSSPTPTPTQEATPTPTVTPPQKLNIGPTAKPIQTPTPQKVTAPAKVTGVKVKNNKKNKTTVSWKKVKDASGYELQYTTTKKFKSSKKKQTKKTTITVKKLKKKKTYYFRVRAYYTINGKKDYGKWSSVRKLKIKK